MNTTKIKTELDFEIEIIHEQCDEMLSCYIPEIDGYFSARTLDDARKTGSAMIKSFIRYWKMSNDVENRSEEVRSMWGK